LSKPIIVTPRIWVCQSATHPTAARRENSAGPGRTSHPRSPRCERSTPIGLVWHRHIPSCRIAGISGHATVPPKTTGALHHGKRRQTARQPGSQETQGRQESSTGIGIVPETAGRGEKAWSKALEIGPPIRHAEPKLRSDDDTLSCHRQPSQLIRQGGSASNSRATACSAGTTLPIAAPRPPVAAAYSGPRPETPAPASASPCRPD
jgi:hypothetical protein